MGKGREWLNIVQPISSASRSIPELHSAAAPAMPAQLWAPRRDVTARVSWVAVQHRRAMRRGCRHGERCQWDTRPELPSDRKFSLNTLDSCRSKMECQRERLCLGAKRGRVGLQGETLCTFAETRVPLPVLLVRTRGDGWVGADPGICPSAASAGPERSSPEDDERTMEALTRPPSGRLSGAPRQCEH